MAPREPDRLSALDALFLHQEERGAPMQIGALAIFDGPPPTLGELRARVAQRLAGAPRYRSRLVHTPLDRGRPAWAPDPAFRIERHVERAALAAPGDRTQLRRFAARTISTALERDRALWALWLVEGLCEGGFALVFTSHHALGDGLAGVELARLVLDGPEGAPTAPASAARAPALPGPLALLAGGAAEAMRGAGAGARAALEAALAPRRALTAAGEALAAIAEVARLALAPVPRTPLSVADGAPHRRIATGSCSLADVAAVRAAHGGTVNDVLLAAVSGALRRLLAARGGRGEELELFALVPVSMRGAAGGPGNRLAAVRVALPVAIADPLDRLAAVRSAMDAAKASRQARGVAVLARLPDLAPPALVGALARLPFGRLVNLIVTNVPGPPETLHLLGRTMREAYPLAPLAPGHALAVGLLSYDGRVGIGLVAEHDALPELDALAGWIEAELAELVRRAPAAR